MRLFELAFAVRLYGQLTAYDASIARLRDVAPGGVDLEDAGQVKACLNWLNDWGCRQFALEYHDSAAAVLAEWWRDWISRLPSDDSDLATLDADAVLLASMAYGDLAQREASGGCSAMAAARLSPWDQPAPRRSSTR